MSDRELIKKLANIVIKQQKIQNKILQKLGVDTGVADDALKKLTLDSTTNWLVTNGISGKPSVSISRNSADPTAMSLAYSVDVTLTVNTDAAKLSAENSSTGLLAKLRADFQSAVTKPNSPLSGCTAEFTVTTLVGQVK